MSNKAMELCARFEKLKHEEINGSLIKKRKSIMKQLKALDPDAYEQWINSGARPSKFFNNNKRK